MTAINSIDTVNCLEFDVIAPIGFTIANRYIVLAVPVLTESSNQKREHKLEKCLHRCIWYVDTKAHFKSSEDHICRPFDCGCIDIKCSNETGPYGGNDSAENHGRNLGSLFLVWCNYGFLNTHIIACTADEKTCQDNGKYLGKGQRYEADANSHPKKLFRSNIRLVCTGLILTYRIIRHT